MSYKLVDCPGCGLPEQHPGLPCGYCGNTVPMPTGPEAEIKEVIGWRAWHVKDTPEGTRLTSTGYGGGAHKHVPWTPGAWMLAHCTKSEHNPNAVPDLRAPVVGCTCGFYAARTREHLLSLNAYHRYDQAGRVVVMGTVQMSGKVVPASNGFRAGKVRPRVVYVPYEFWQDAAKLKDTYEPHGVTIELGNTLVLPVEESKEWCPKCGAKMEPRTFECEWCGTTLR